MTREHGGSHRQIIRSSVLMGSASIVTTLVGVARLKGLAVMLGPVGVGLVGLYLNLVTVGATIAGFGLNASGVREIAAAKASGDPVRLATERRALFAGSLLLAMAGLLIVWLFRDQIAKHALADGRLSTSVGWLSIAVALTVLSSACLTLLNGYRDLRALAWVQVAGASLGTVVGLGCVVALGHDALIPYVIAAPAASLLIGGWFVRRLPRVRVEPVAPSSVTKRIGALMTLGSTFMLSGLALSAGVLLVRGMIADRLGDVALGQFAATWIISNTYVSVVLQAMGMDFFPRLSAAIDDRQQAARLINEQVEAAVLLATPIFLFTMAAAPWILRLAYSSEFVAGASLLRWQILGDVLKVASWPLSIALLAARRGKTYLVVETIAALTFVGFVFVFISRLGEDAAGIGYAVMYLVYFAVLLIITAARFHLTRTTSSTIGAAIAATAVIFGLVRVSEMASLVVGLALSALATVFVVVRLRTLGALPDRIAKLLPGGVA